MPTIYQKLDASEEEKALHAIFAHPTTKYLIELLKLYGSISMKDLLCYVYEQVKPTQLGNKEPRSLSTRNLLHEIYEQTKPNAAQAFSLVNRGLVKYEDGVINDSGLLEHYQKMDRYLGHVVKDDAGVKHVFFDPAMSLAARKLEEGKSHINDLHKELKGLYGRETNIEDIINVLQRSDLLTRDANDEIGGRDFSKQYFELIKRAKTL